MLIEHLKCLRCSATGESLSVRNVWTTEPDSGEILLGTVQSSSRRYSALLYPHRDLPHLFFDPGHDPPSLLMSLDFVKSSNLTYLRMSPVNTCAEFIPDLSQGCWRINPLYKIRANGQELRLTLREPPEEVPEVITASFPQLQTRRNVCIPPQKVA